MNKKLLATTLLCMLGLVTLSKASAYSYDYNYRAFIGGDLQRSFFATKDYGPTALTTNLGITQISLGAIEITKGQLQNYDDSFSIFAGYNLYNFGFQIGYTRFNSIIYSYFQSPIDGRNIYATQKGYNLYLDLIYFLQLNSRHVLKGILGIGSLKTYMSVSFTSNEPATLNNPYEFDIQNTRVGPRIGFGWQYNLTRKWTTDITYKYQLGNDLYSQMQTVAIALSYYFQ